MTAWTRSRAPTFARMRLGLDRRLLYDELGGDLPVREPARDERQHLALARGELVQARVPSGIRRRLPGHALATRRVTEGESSESPAAIV